MNIQKVKDEIKNTVKMYLARGPFGAYEVEEARQRPLFIIGAPGIGKTAVVKQVADEMHLGFVSYTITHHTRQSAIGLPFVKQKNYGGQQYSVTEYTLSEIVDSVYDAIERQKQKEGILFIDEINCVSETLAPAMLELLQNKKFGPHKIPEGWVLVAAGNPHEYNKSVKDFDIVTLDRVKKVEAEPDFAVWKKYAYDAGVHPAVLYYLGLKPQSLFSVQKTVDGVSFVTPRGWEDVSVAITMYEKLGFEITQPLIYEYVQNYEIATEFFRCYLLTIQYKRDYDVEKILAGEYAGEGAEKLKAAPFDERLAVIEVLSGSINQKARESVEAVAFERALKPVYSGAMMSDGETDAFLEEKIDEIKEKLALKTGGEKEKNVNLRLLGTLTAARSGEDATAALEEAYALAGKESREKAAFVKSGVENAIAFIESTFGKGQELTALLIALVSSQSFVTFLARNSCPVFMQYNQELLTDRQSKQLLVDIEKLGL